MSADPRYCQGCYEVFKSGKREESGPKDYWTKDGNLFIHYEKKYGITKSGGTVYLGAIQETPPDGADSLLSSEEVVSIIPAKEIIPTTEIQAQANGIMKQRGRPRKEGEVSRVTAWRRRKERQLMASRGHKKAL